ncbi:MAG: chondroitinase-B domain-containing protein [Planctomycetota bacterium]|jgi:hypothetical protein
MKTLKRLLLMALISTSATYGNAAIECDAGGKLVKGSKDAERGANAVTSGDLYIEPSTLHCLSFQWRITGDKNRNSTVKVRFRALGEKVWKKGMNLLRMQNEKISWKKSQMEGTAPNMHAGSIMFLKPATTYEVELKMSDPDGGSITKIIKMPTKTEPKKFSGGKRLHVYPADFKGTKRSPAFADLRAAYAKAEPGDRVLLHAGNYSGLYDFEKSGTREKPIVIEAAGDGEVIFTGEFIQTGDTPKGKNWDETQICFDMSNSKYNWVEGITFKYYNYGIYVGGEMQLREMKERKRGKKFINYSVNGELRKYDESYSKYAKQIDDRQTTGLTIRYCTFIDNGWSGIMLFNTRNRDLYVADNICYGSAKTFIRKKKPLFPYKGVWVAGQGADVCYNRTQYHKDGISFLQNRRDTNVVEFAEKGCAIDFYNNDVGQSWDDNEADGADHNIRFFNNRLVDQAVGLSAQPLYGGPCYFVRNVLYNITYSAALKLNCEPSGVIALNNTIIGGSSISQDWSNCIIYNNIFIRQNEKAVTFRAGIADPEISKLDYNAYMPGGIVMFHNAEKVNSKDFKEVQKLGFEKNRILVDYAIFKNITPPEGEKKVCHNLDFGDPGLKEDASVIDKAKLINNINDDFTGRGPDIGAFEYGKEMPHYGPRSR